MLQWTVGKILIPDLPSSDLKDRIKDALCVYQKVFMHKILNSYLMSSI